MDDAPVEISDKKHTGEFAVTVSGYPVCFFFIYFSSCLISEYNDSNISRDITETHSELSQHAAGSGARKVFRDAFFYLGYFFERYRELPSVDQNHRLILNAGDHGHVHDIDPADLQELIAKLLREFLQHGAGADHNGFEEYFGVFVV